MYINKIRSQKLHTSLFEAHWCYDRFLLEQAGEDQLFLDVGELDAVLEYFDVFVVLKILYLFVVFVVEHFRGFRVCFEIIYQRDERDQAAVYVRVAECAVAI